jgi:hypothetical protein
MKKAPLSASTEVVFIGVSTGEEHVMRDSPFVTVGIAEQLGDGHEEHPPAMKPAFGVGAVGVAEDRHDRFARGVHAVQPGVGRVAIVVAGQPPLVVQHQIVLESGEQIFTGHDAAGEEMARHPVVFAVVLEFVGQQLVREYVYEQSAVVDQPAIDTREQLAVIAHVFEHLDRHNTVELAFARIERVDVAGFDGQVLYPALAGHALDRGPLGV